MPICPQCWAQLQSKAALKVHMKSSHDKRRKQCPVCSSFFKAKGLKMHLAKKHGNGAVSKSKKKPVTAKKNPVPTNKTLAETDEEMDIVTLDDSLESPPTMETEMVEVGMVVDHMELVNGEVDTPLVSGEDQAHGQEETESRHQVVALAETEEHMDVTGEEGMIGEVAPEVNQTVGPVVVDETEGAGQDAAVVTNKTDAVVTNKTDAVEQTEKVIEFVDLTEEEDNNDGINVFKIPRKTPNQPLQKAESSARHKVGKTGSRKKTSSASTKEERFCISRFRRILQMASLENIEPVRAVLRDAINNADEALTDTSAVPSAPDNIGVIPVVDLVEEDGEEE